MTMISRIEQKERGKQKIYLEDGTGFVLYQKERKTLELVPEMELSSEDYQRILQDILIPRAKKRALHLLEKMDRTEAQLREKLSQNEYPKEAIEAAVDYVKGYHYIDDLRYAENYIRCRCENQSRRQLALKLSQKGVDRGYIDRALEEAYGEEEESSKILRWLEKKQYDRETADVRQKQRMYQFLMRKGFRSGDILSLI